MRSSIEVYPNLLKEFNFKKNYPLIPKNIAKSSQKKIWWVCINNHEWKARVSSRTYYSKSCPYCSGRKPTSINNINLKPKNVSKYSNKKVWWLCLKGHGYKTTIASRSNGTGCPYCSNLFSSEHNNLNFLYPDIAKEWHPIKNANLKPTDVTKSSGKKVWWICSYGHEWETVISTRTKKKTRCPYCVKYKIYKKIKYNLNH
jgi:uncharacterized Zn-finger protein